MPPQISLLPFTLLACESLNKPDFLKTEADVILEFANDEDGFTQADVKQGLKFKGYDYDYKKRQALYNFLDGGKRGSALERGVSSLFDNGFSPSTIAKLKEWVSRQKVRTDRFKDEPQIPENTNPEEKPTIMPVAPKAEIKPKEIKSAPEEIKPVPEEVKTAPKKVAITWSSESPHIGQPFSYSWMVRDAKTGETKPLSDYNLKGKLVFFSFWGSFCGPCLLERQLMNQLDSSITNNSQVVFVNVLTSPEDNIAKMVRSKYPVSFSKEVQDSSKDFYTEYAQELGGYIPLTVVVGPDGTVVDSHVGLDDVNFEKHIATLVSQL